MKTITIQVPEWEDVELSYKHDPDFLTAFHAFEEMRKKIKKPMTEHAKVLALKTMVKSNWNKEFAIHNLERNTFNCWQGMYEDKDYVQKSRYINPTY